MKKTITIKKNFEFKRLLQKGFCVKGKYIVIYYYKNNMHIENNKVGFIVSKKAGNSVERNRLRRLLRQSYSEIEDKIKNGNIMLIMWKTMNEDKKIKCCEIFCDLEKLCKESDLLI